MSWWAVRSSSSSTTGRRTETKRTTAVRWSPSCSGEAGFVVDGVVVVSADEIEIRNALNTAVIGGVDLVISVGGTGRHAA